MRYKKLYIILILIIIFCLVGCGNFSSAEIEETLEFLIERSSYLNSYNATKTQKYIFESDSSDKIEGNTISQINYTKTPFALDLYFSDNERERVFFDNVLLIRNSDKKSYYESDEISEITEGRNYYEDIYLHETHIQLLEEYIELIKLRKIEEEYYFYIDFDRDIAENIFVNKLIGIFDINLIEEMYLRNLILEVKNLEVKMYFNIQTGYLSKCIYEIVYEIKDSNRPEMYFNNEKVTTIVFSKHNNVHEIIKEDYSISEKRY